MNRPAATTARPQRKRRREEIKDVPPCSDSESPGHFGFITKIQNNIDASSKINIVDCTQFFFP